MAVSQQRPCDGLDNVLLGNVGSRHLLLLLHQMSQFRWFGHLLRLLSTQVPLGGGLGADPRLGREIISLSRLGNASMSLQKSWRLRRWKEGRMDVNNVSNHIHFFTATFGLVQHSSSSWHVVLKGWFSVHLAVWQNKQLLGEFCCIRAHLDLLFYKKNAKRWKFGACVVY